MNRYIVFIAITLLSSVSAIAQQIPVGSCGFVYLHDAAGNRTKAVYFCNNGIDPYPSRVGSTPQAHPEITDAELKTMEFQPVNAIYPNPTTGRFSITFSVSVSGAAISITDAAGKTIEQIKASGTRVDFDLSSRPSGIYYVRIEENGKVISKKIVKR